MNENETEMNMSADEGGVLASAAALGRALSERATGYADKTVVKFVRRYASNSTAVREYTMVAIWVEATAAWYVSDGTKHSNEEFLDLLGSAGVSGVMVAWKWAEV